MLAWSQQQHHLFDLCTWLLGWDIDVMREENSGLVFPSESPKDYSLFLGGFRSIKTAMSRLLALSGELPPPLLDSWDTVPTLFA